MHLDLVVVSWVYTNVKIHRAVYLFICSFYSVYICFQFFFSKLLVCLSQRGLNRSQEVYFYAYKSSQVLFAQRTKQLEIRWQQLPGIEKGWERVPNPCTTPCDCHTLPGHFQPGCTRWTRTRSLSFSLTSCSPWYSVCSWHPINILLSTLNIR